MVVSRVWLKECILPRVIIKYEATCFSVIEQSPFSLWCLKKKRLTLIGQGPPECPQFGRKTVVRGQ